MITFPRWKYYLLACVLCLGFIYALPNLYGDDPAVQIKALSQNMEGSGAQKSNQDTVGKISTLLAEAEVRPKAIQQEKTSDEGDTILVRLSNPEDQLKAKEVLRKGLGESYSVALNLAPLTPHWLSILGAEPMKLGLDLRGGVHFLLEVDFESMMDRRLQEFAGAEKNAEALSKNQIDDMIRQIRNETMEQTVSTLRKRVNELGVAEAIVQRQGLNRVVVQLPGIQDTAYARDILGKTATLKFLLEDDKNDINTAFTGRVIPGSKLYTETHGVPVLLKEKVILSGESVTGATTGTDRDNRPAVNIRLGGDVSHFVQITRENIGRRMAVVYVEMHDQKIKETLISLATINGVLGNNFQITGFSIQGARDLALLLRAGALPAAIAIVEERIVGPSMGQDNIRMGMTSVAVGLGLVMLCMILYYGAFGMLANVALMANLILLLAVMSLIGATLTLPGIAGIVLTLGMAVDANVLIFERIREELRLGLSPQASIHRGFEYAFATIIDSNLTTLIVGVILFTIGSGPIKGFAVTLCIGILTTLLTATMGSRALVHLFFGSRTLKRVRVGI
jgi:preprotein translocase subunit SecD